MIYMAGYLRLLTVARWPLYPLQKIPVMCW